FQRKRTLANCRETIRRIDERHDALPESQALEPRCGKDHGGVSTLVELAQPRVDVTSQGLDLDRRTALSQLRLTTQARSADHAACGQFAQRAVHVGNERVA